MGIMEHTCRGVVLSSCVIIPPELSLVQEHNDINFSVRKLLNCEDLKGGISLNPTFMHRRPKYNSPGVLAEID